MNPQRLQARGLHGRAEEPAAEGWTAELSTGRGRKQGCLRIGIGEPAHVLAQLCNDGAWEGDSPEASPGLRWVTNQMAADLAQGLRDRDGAGYKVDGHSPECGELADPQAPVGGDVDQGSVSLVDGSGQQVDFVRFEKAHLGALDSRELYAIGWIAWQVPRLNGSSQDLGEDLERLVDRGGGVAV